jgi:hypothetical protein
MTRRRIAFEASGPAAGFVISSEHDPLYGIKYESYADNYVISYSFYNLAVHSHVRSGLFAGAAEASDLALDGDTLSTASMLPNSCSSNAPSDVSKQVPQSVVDAWNLTLNAAKLVKTVQGAAGLAPNPARGGGVRVSPHLGVNRMSN